MSSPGHFEGRVPPHDLDAEAAVLSAIFIDNQSIDLVRDLLTPETFYAEAHRRIFEAMLALEAAGTTIDIVTVGTRLKASNRIEQVGGMAYLTEILNVVPAVAHARDYARRVQELWLQRRTIVVLMAAVANLYLGVEDSSAFFDKLERDVHAITTVRGRGKGFEKLGDINARVLRDRHEAEREGRNVAGHPTGFQELDEVTGGLHGGDLIVVAARPGMGKTSYAMNIATNVAAVATADGQLPYVALVFSLEMAREQLALRTLCSEGRIDLRLARTGAFSEASWGRLNRAAAKLQHLGVFIDDTGARSLEEIWSATRRKKAEVARAGQKVVLVAIDYLGLMKVPAAERHDLAIQYVTSGSKAMAKELDVAVILLAQLNRECEKRLDKKPITSDLRDSGAIEQDADRIEFIYRDEHYDANSPYRNKAEIIIDKQRNGPRGTVKLGFEKEAVRFYSLGDARQ